MLRLAGACFVLLLAVSTARAQDMPEPVREIFRRSLVSVGLGENSGSGFLIGEEGHILTAWHVLANLSPRGTAGIFPTRFTVYPNVEGHENCEVRTRLVGASEYRDVAVLEIRPSTWERRNDPLHDTHRCLAEMRPVKLYTDVDIAGNDAASDDESLFDQRIWVMGRPAGCRPGSNPGRCIALDFEVSARHLERQEDPEGFGLHNITGQTVVGMSGGPVAQSDGQVIGMTLMSGRQRNLDVMQALPASSLVRPLWTFGIVYDGSDMGDYMDDILTLVGLKKDIESALDTLQDFRNRLNKPHYRDYVVNTIPGIGSIVTFDLSKQLSRIPTPDRFDFTVRCEPDPSIGFDITRVTQQQAEEARLRNAYPIEVESRPPVELADGTTFRVSLPRAIEDFQQECRDYFNDVASLSGQNTVYFNSSDFKRFRIVMIAVFEDGDLESHALDEVMIVHGEGL